MTNEECCVIIRHALRHYLATQTPAQLCATEPWLTPRHIETALALWPFTSPETAAYEALIAQAAALAAQCTLTQNDYACLLDVLHDALGQPPNPDVERCIATLQALTSGAAP